MITHYMKQGTKEWLDVRKLKFTASHANTIMAMGKGLESLIDEMLADYYSSGTYEEYSQKFKSSAMQRGNDFEDKSRQIYELETGYSVDQVGFVEISENIGCSPDGLIGKDGMVEFKNHGDTVFLKLMETKKIDKKYADQIQMQLYVTGRDWCDYFGFNPNFDPCYFKVRIYPDIRVFEKLSKALPYAVNQLKKRKDALDKVIHKQI